MNILISTDFSRSAQNAADFAINIFGIENNQYILANTYQLPSTGAATLVSLRDILRESSADSLVKEKKRLVNMFGEKLNIQTLAYEGHFAESINQISKNESVDILVVGTKGAKGLRKLLMESNAAEILRLANLPVLIVPQTYSGNTVKKIVFAADYQHIDNVKQLNLLKELAFKSDANMDILNIQPDGSSLGVDEALEGMAIHEELNEIPHEFKMVNDNDIEHGIGRYTDQYNPDLLVMVPRKKSFFEHLFQKSTVRNITAHTKTPILAFSL